MGRTQFDKFEKMRENILENFDFPKCEKTMRKINWTWGFDNRHPTVEDLKKTASYLMESAAKGCLESKDCREDQTYIASTGGLKAEAIKNKHGHLVYLNLEFVLTDWNVDEDDA